MRVIYMASAIICLILSTIIAIFSDITITNNLIHIYFLVIMGNIFVIMSDSINITDKFKKFENK